jgi:hypothetical protein
MSPDSLDNAFFFIVNRMSYFNQAVFSAMHIEEIMPNNPVIMFIAEPLDWTRNGLPHNYFRGRIKLNPDDEYVKKEIWFLEQNHLMAAAVNCLSMMGVSKAVYLDSDTYMVDPVPELFELLDHFDFAGSHAPGRQTANTTYPIPLCFPEINIGVNPMVINGRMEEFWNTVAAQHLENLNTFGNNDQAPLRQTLYGRSKWGGTNFYVLPPEYNLRYHFPFMVKGRVKILHGPQEYAARVAELVNRNQGDMRSWEKILDNLSL